MSTPSETQFGKYVLLDRIAAGGMAEIFRARYAPAPGVTKQVVIKKILPHYAENRGFIAMFTNEARIAMGLSHGNIAQVFDFGAIDGDYFLAMELVDGQPLSKALKRAKALGIPVLPTEFAVFVAIEMLKGLHYAHTRLDEAGRPLKIVHRDVSPQNVLVSFEGQIKLVDFGIAKARNAGNDDTSANAVKGKYAYFAPEQARAKELDARTDVFAAGIVLYEMVTGQLPFQGRMMDVLARLVRGQFPRPRELNPNLPKEVERIILKAMALEKNDRYQSADAFQQDLSRWLAESHPGFTHGQLGLLLQLLFEEELVAESRPVQLPREFVERARGWKQELPTGRAPALVGPRPSGDEEAPTEMMAMGEERGETKPLPRFAEAPRFDDAPARAKFPVGRAIVLGLVAMFVGFIGVTLFARMQKSTMEIVSSPAGARVVFDGRTLPQVTPVVLKDLEGSRKYRIEIALDGYVKWNNEVPLKRGQHLVVQAPLEKLPPPPPPEPVKIPEPVTPPPPPPVADEVRWPVAKFELDAAKHRLDLSKAGALVVKLDPAQKYRVTLGKGEPTHWGFYVVNDAGAAPGAFGAQPLEINGASRLYAFHVPEATFGAKTSTAKPRTLTVQGNKPKKPATHQVPATLDFPPGARVTITGLSAGSTYELTPHLGAQPAKLRADGPPVALVVLGLPAGGLVLAPVDQATRITNAELAWLTLLDDGGSEASGRLTFELREVKPLKKKHR